MLADVSALVISMNDVDAPKWGKHYRVLFSYILPYMETHIAVFTNRTTALPQLENHVDHERRAINLMTYIEYHVGDYLGLGQCWSKQPGV